MWYIGADIRRQVTIRFTGNQIPIMKLKNPFVYFLAFLALPLVVTVAPAATIEVLQTFDYPEDGVSTLPQKISDQGVMVGTVIDVNGVEQGFFYKPRIGRYSDRPFSDPSDTGGVTRGRGINNQRHSCGEYMNGSDGTFHGYIFEHPDFIPFDITDTVDTVPLGINNGGDFVGTVTFTDGTQLAFINLKGVVKTFAVPDAIATLAYQINRGSQVVGYYIDLDGITHGYMRDGHGNLTFPIDVPGSTGTILFGNNDSSWGVGRYTDEAGLTHGLFYITPDDILTYDYPGSTFTSLNGVNKDGYVAGYYLDEGGIFHGIWAKINLTAASNRNTNTSVAPVRPVRPTPELLEVEAAPAL